MILTVLLFALFLVLGVVSQIQKKGGKWIYFSLSGLTLIALVMMLFFLDWDLSKPEKNNPGPPKTETPAKVNDDPNKENPPL